MDPNNLDCVKCNIWGKVNGGGVYRLKQRIALIKGNVSLCPKSTKEDQLCKKALDEAKNRNKEK